MKCTFTFENNTYWTNWESRLKSALFWLFKMNCKLNEGSLRSLVKDRIVGSVLPWPGKNFVRHYIRNNPDLYGPFWICATLVFAIGISGNISSFLVHHGQPQYKYVPEFRKVTIAATAIYSYAWLVPLALWGFLMWRNSKVSRMVSYSFLEIVCVYGYSLSIYIPAVVLWIIPSEGLRWCSIVLALCLSGSVLMLTFWPAIRDDHPRVVLAVTVTIVTLHVLLAVGCKVCINNHSQSRYNTLYIFIFKYFRLYCIFNMTKCDRHKTSLIQNPSAFALSA
uniref:Protein YIPF n=1 Tax=Astyanax mexicanus TaxID=7994 RepID=A0A3B1IBN2_ASTMX